MVIKTILKKSTGNISVMSVDNGEGLTEKTISFHSFVLIVDGSAEMVIGGDPHFLLTGQSMVIPAHTSHYIKAARRSS